MRRLSKFGWAMMLFWAAVFALSPTAGHTQQSRIKRVLVLYWENQDHPANIDFAQNLRAALESLTPGRIEYYSEYLEATRFPGENAAELLRDYMLQKYAGRTMDVVVATESVALEFLFKYRSELFPGTPIVFASNQRPSDSQLTSGAGATGITYLTSYRKTVELAMKLHPGTQRVFIVSKTPPVGDSWEKLARNDLQGFNDAAITYLTDLPLEELRAKLKALPERSIVLYVWVRLRIQEGEFLESRDVLSSIAPSVRVPIYGLSHANIGRGIVGGYVWTMETRAHKMAELILKLANGARPADLPVENTPLLPMFDWRELKRWGIDEDLLPPGSVVRFRELTFWQQYKRRIVGVFVVLVLQTVLIAALLLARRRSRRAAAALQESEARFRNMADTAPVLIWVSGPGKLYTFFNRAWLIFGGRTIGQEIGNGWAERVHPHDLERWSETYVSAFDSRCAFQTEYRLRRADGEYRCLLCEGVPRFQHDGAFAGYIGSCVDITDLKRAQERALAGQKLESMGLLSSGIAHDFNNLLGGILTSAELALTEHAEGAPWEEELLRIKAAAVSGAQIVRELMILGAKDDPAFEPVNCSLLVREMVQMLKVLISKSAVLKIDSEERVMVRGNAAQIRQLIMNLVINASQAIGERTGEIRIAMKMLTKDQSAPFAVEANLPGVEYLMLEVADTGAGMTEEVKAKIFDPFFSTKAAGRGLGLAVVQGVVRAHKGVVRLVSSPGSGTTFQVLLPCIPAGESTKEERGASSPRPAAGQSPAGTVLFIEDEPTLRTATSKFLRRRGFSVIEAEDGNVGTELCLKNAARIDVVLLDMTLPGKSGREVLVELQRLKPDVKVIVTSAYGRSDVQNSLDGLRYWGYIQKPYQLAELERLLRNTQADKIGHATA